jgi:hypothetical protein
MVAGLRSARERGSDFAPGLAFPKDAASVALKEPIIMFLIALLNESSVFALRV